MPGVRHIEIRGYESGDRAVLEVQLDQRWMKLSEILSLEEGSIIEMRRSAGENLDIYIGSRLAAFGEIVIIERPDKR